MSLILLGVILPWLFVSLFVAVGAWIGYQLIHQNGRLLARLEALELRLTHAPTSWVPGMAPAPGTAPLGEPPQPSGLPLGSPAPEFELPDLNGERRSLAQFLGRRLLLVFFNPRCGFCTQLAPQLAALPTEGQDGPPLPLVVSTGEAEENYELVQQYGLHGPVLLQEAGTHGVGGEVASQYQCHGTPMGYLIDEQGKIASERAVGGPALLALAGGETARWGAGEPERNGHHPNGANGNGRAALGGKRSLAESKIERNGLAPGTVAPAFTLPRLGGGELSLKEYRGRKVLLVFSDSNCGPCDQLAPQLARLGCQTPELSVLLVSRGAEEQNRMKAAEHGLKFPIGLQRQWEISREYGIFATPVAYLIVENGVIAAEVAVGVEPVIALLSRAAATQRLTPEPLALRNEEQR